MLKIAAGRCRAIALVLAVAASLAAVGLIVPSQGARGEGQSLAGRLLVASPDMGDPRFVETVIYMVRHDATGAMGLVLNRLIGTGPVSALLQEFGVEDAAGETEIRMHYGGPVEGARGFVLHSTDYMGDGTLVVNDEVALTANLEVLRAIAGGTGPERSFFALGYAGWAAGQLESELAANAWYTVPADEKLVFDETVDDKWDRAMAKRGVDL
jgi:putative transcriptional regulator